MSTAISKRYQQQDTYQQQDSINKLDVERSRSRIGQFTIGLSHGPSPPYLMKRNGYQEWQLVT